MEKAEEAKNIALADDRITEASRSKRRGIFIVIEGLDRAGKSTQVASLAKALGCKAIKFPDRTTAIGKMIDSYLAQKSDIDDRAIHLLFSANRWEASESILKSLERGEDIVCDRYAFSGIAYSNAKGLDFEWCRAPDVGLIRPDLSLFLHLSPGEAAKRGGYGEERYETLTMQTEVRKSFSRIAAEMEGHGWRTIDAGRGIDEVAEDCRRLAIETVSEVEKKKLPIGKLFMKEAS